jgi:drug/metabolite transporter (DMT)-like permease
MDPSILLSIICASAWGTQAVFVKLALGGIALPAMILLTLVVNLLVVASCIGVTTEGGFSQFFAFSHSVYIYFMVAGFLNYFLGRGFYYSSFRFIGATRATAISSTYPLLSVALAIFGLGEKLAPRQYLGIALTLAGVYLLIMKGKK